MDMKRLSRNSCAMVPILISNVMSNAIAQLHSSTPAQVDTLGLSVCCYSRVAQIHP